MRLRQSLDNLFHRQQVISRSPNSGPMKDPWRDSDDYGQLKHLGCYYNRWQVDASLPVR